MALSKLISTSPITVTNPSQLEKKLTSTLIRKPLSQLDFESKTNLLKTLLMLNREQEAIALTELLMTNEPKNWGWSLIRSELTRETEYKRDSAQQIDKLYALHPKNLEILKLKILLDLELGKKKLITSLLEKKFAESKPENRIEIGLILADVYIQNQNLSGAQNTYQALSEENINDGRPLLALAFIKHEQGKYKIAKELLREVLKKDSKKGFPQKILNQIAKSWSIESEKSRKRNY